MQNNCYNTDTMLSWFGSRHDPSIPSDSIPSAHGRVTLNNRARQPPTAWPHLTVKNNLHARPPERRLIGCDWTCNRNKPITARLQVQLPATPSQQTMSRWVLVSALARKPCLTQLTEERGVLSTVASERLYRLSPRWDMYVTERGNEEIQSSVTTKYLELNFTVLFVLELASFLHWPLHRYEATPFLTELHAIGVHNCEVFKRRHRVAQDLSDTLCSNDKRIAKKGADLNEVTPKQNVHYMTEELQAKPPNNEVGSELTCFGEQPALESSRDKQAPLRYGILSGSAKCGNDTNIRRMYEIIGGRDQPNFAERFLHGLDFNTLLDYPIRIRRGGGERTVAERLARSPPTNAHRALSLAGSPDFRKWESCQTMPLIGWFSRGYPVSPVPSFQAAPYSLQSPSSALEISLLRAAQISSLTQAFFGRFCKFPHEELNVISGDKNISRDKIDAKHVYTEVDFAIGSHSIRQGLDDSQPIADLQGSGDGWKGKARFWPKGSVFVVRKTDPRHRGRLGEALRSCLSRVWWRGIKVRRRRGAGNRPGPSPKEMLTRLTLSCRISSRVTGGVIGISRSNTNRRMTDKHVSAQQRLADTRAGRQFCSMRLSS
ncbi:hypothetical protein PR048_032836 [Dryococelus australis]|uniref:Uncharacterized protein n=1 Tax=Dryococelus australis TaxID=614101 RepID=A0ABQ9G3B9_9NEOP|nr:hypothetical protein PR048_032836 [Dryococelus australis]